MLLKENSKASKANPTAKNPIAQIEKKEEYRQYLQDITDALAQAKPRLIENRVNKATDAHLRG